MVCHEKICQDYKLSKWDGYKQHLFVLTRLSLCYNVMIGGTSSLPWGGWLHLSIPGTPISDHPAVGVSLQEKWWSPLMHPSKLFMRLNHLWMVLVNLHTKHRNICDAKIKLICIDFFQPKFVHQFDYSAVVFFRQIYMQHWEYCLSTIIR